MDKFEFDGDTVELILWIAAMFAAIYIPLTPML